MLTYNKWRSNLTRHTIFSTPLNLAISTLCRTPETYAYTTDGNLSVPTFSLLGPGLVLRYAFGMFELGYRTN